MAAISTFLTKAGANIVTLDQHATEEEDGAFFQRTEFHLPGLPAAREDLERAFAAEVANEFGMQFRLTEAARPKRVAIMVVQDRPLSSGPAVAQPSGRARHERGRW